ncbi:MAG: hypothetical protein NTX24_00440 [Candidatus Pacearchaeota archaeon]|nr:hypothetical protein [Candidatus Pacearchaeota archaeon]
MVKKRFSLAFLSIFSLFCVSLLLLTSVEAGVTITKQAVTDTVAVELTIPARYMVTIHNGNGYDDNFGFVVLVNAFITPKTSVLVPAGESVTTEVGLLPLDRFRGNFMYSYYVRGDKTQAVEDKMFVKVSPLKAILSITIPAEFSREDSALPIRIVNKDNIDFGKVDFKFTSDALTAVTTATIGPNSDQIINIPLDTQKLKTVEAGNYNSKLILWLNNEYNYTIEQSVKLKEFSNIVTESSTKGSIFGYTKTITYKNNGNIKQVVTVKFPYRHFIERVFTNFNIDPTTDTKTEATWQRQLEPGESFVIITETDYMVPILIIALIIVAIIGYILVRQKKVIVSKKAIKIRTKGGELAVKIITVIKNVSGLEVGNLMLVDRLPPTTQLYEKFGTVKPDNTEKHKLEWKFPSILPGEEVVVSYVLYSKMRMIGTIQIPQATLFFNDTKNKRHAVNSNKLFVMAG